MIKNIIFDLGNVLISFKPAEYLSKKKYPENIKSIILSDIFGSKEWLKLDNGDMTVNEAIDSISLNSVLKKEEIARIFDSRIDLMYPLQTNANILPELKKRGFKLYFLSNFPLDIFDEVKSSYHFFKFFDGGIISAEVRSSKPEKRIYEILLERFSLTAEECLFIDDNEINVKSAQQIGMQGIATSGSLEIASRIENILSRSSVN